ncbi:hypothetical protein [Streptomyces sp. SID11385]|uniref:hypothetical protein n=1 Tax=Streptomyces sp. SID11385 TaxID=2706031 RepID=UPI001EF17703|nr:hypothetical protein [Streptomyces sp. SID11385]
MGDGDGGEQFAEQLDQALDTAIDAAGEVKEAAAKLRHAEDSNPMADSQDYSLSKQRHKMGKLVAGAAGESLKAASGAATIATAVTAGLATTPVGWGLAAAAAGRSRRSYPPSRRRPYAPELVHPSSPRPAPGRPHGRTPPRTSPRAARPSSPSLTGTPAPQR